MGCGSAIIFRHGDLSGTVDAVDKEIVAATSACVKQERTLVTGSCSFKHQAGREADGDRIIVYRRNIKIYISVSILMCYGYVISL